MHGRVISTNMHAELQEVQTVSIYVCFSLSDANIHHRNEVTLNSFQKYIFGPNHELNVVVTR